MLLTPWGSLFSGASITAEGLAGTVSGTSEVTGQPTVKVFLSGSLDGASLLTGGFFIAVPLAGAINGLSEITGEVLLTVRLSGSANGSSTATGDFFDAVELAGSLVGTSTAAINEVILHVIMEGIAEGTSSLSESGVIYVSLSGVVAGTSGLEGSFLLALPEQIKNLAEAVFTPVEEIHPDFDYVLTAGTTIPYVRGFVTDQDGAPLEIVEADLTFTMTDKLFNIVRQGDAVLEDSETGQIVFIWDDTSDIRPGVYYALFKADFGVNRIVSMPSARYIRIAVQKDLDEE